MTSAAHHLHRPWLGSAPRAGLPHRALLARRALRVAALYGAAVACLVAGAVLLVLTVGGIDTHGRVPHPAPLPVPTGWSVSGG